VWLPVNSPIDPKQIALPAGTDPVERSVFFMNSHHPNTRYSVPVGFDVRCEGGIQGFRFLRSERGLPGAETFPDQATQQIVGAVKTGRLTPQARFLLRQTVDALLAGELAGVELAFYVAHDDINGLRAVLAKRSRSS